MAGMIASPQNFRLPYKPARVLAFIRAYYLQHGLPPAEPEIASGLGIEPRLANYYLLFLERGGYLRRQHGLKRNIALTALGVSVQLPGARDASPVPPRAADDPEPPARAPGASPVPQRAAEDPGPPARARDAVTVAKVQRLLEMVFPYGNDEQCDICGRRPKAGEDRFCAGCRLWLGGFVQAKPRGAAASVALDIARCLAMMLRYDERPG